jgi:hypothetical protein
MNSALLSDSRLSFRLILLDAVSGTTIEHPIVSMLLFAFDTRIKSPSPSGSNYGFLGTDTDSYFEGDSVEGLSDRYSLYNLKHGFV